MTDMGDEDAVQESGPEEDDAQPAPGDSGEVGEGDAEGEEVAPEGEEEEIA